MKKWFIVIALLHVLIFIILFNKQINLESSDSWELPLSGKIIVLDPGHGGPDGGAVGRGNVIEKDVTLNISLKLRDYLQEAGAYVVMTRETDRDLADENIKGYSRRKTDDLYKRLAMINEPNRDLFISVHLNAIPSPKWRGAQTFYNPTNDESRNVSIFIQDELRRNLGNTDRKAKSLTSVFILKEAKIPGAIVEVGFLSNPTEEELLKQSEYQTKVAASIYQGILRYFTNEEPPEE
ncbi:N-acetylmuramoyl-L-alanine amidase CwlD [Pueribacillus theae]|uniref:N-acetylmuramoyl-L-alanine amidase CwlD n=1 Tax=Pueribacillus theae TaxID=2171751 RepID=A0A2U1K660_9BACI|nr:N-acetylmuramoyl-L-alanine amidase CwlD [Pueribacillus theae]PWA12872.1 N-acetylmuramoyl-L-alanine amidase CwlD [Pueribacillus theae]